MDVTALGQAGLQGWRKRLADRLAGPVSSRTPLSADQARALLGGAFFVLSVVYVGRTLGAMRKQARA